MGGSSDGGGGGSSGGRGSPSSRGRSRSRDNARGISAARGGGRSDNGSVGSKRRDASLSNRYSGASTPATSLGNPNFSQNRGGGIGGTGKDYSKGGQNSSTNYVGAGVGSLIGAVIGGPFGALLGGFVGSGQAGSYLSSLGGERVNNHDSSRGNDRVRLPSAQAAPAPLADVVDEVDDDTVQQEIKKRKKINRASLIQGNSFLSSGYTPFKKYGNYYA